MVFLLWDWWIKNNDHNSCCCKSMLTKQHVTLCVNNKTVAYYTLVSAFSITPCVLPFTLTPSSLASLQICAIFCFCSVYLFYYKSVQPAVHQKRNSAAALHGFWCSCLSSNHRTEYLPRIFCPACPLCGYTRGCKPIFNPPLNSLSLPDMENKKAFKTARNLFVTFAETYSCCNYN